MPLITIITVCYNNLQGLQKTVDSVLAQDFPDFEFLVIDGASKDGTVEYLKTLPVNKLVWTSEKDRGIFHAMNKGVLSASGDYMLFLNSGDLLASATTLSKLAPELDGTQVVYGDQYIDKDEDRYPDILSFGYFFRHGTLPHQASFMHRTLFEEYGLYDERCRICADTVFFMNVICRLNATYKHIDQFVSIVNREGISSQDSSWEIIRKEITESWERDFPAFYQDYKSMHEKIGSIDRSRLVKTLNKVGLLKALKS